MRFKVLGPLEVDHPGRRVTAPRELAIMARLLLEPGVPVSKDVLVEGLWRDNPPPSARRTVDSILSRLASYPKPKNALIDPTSLPAYQSVADRLMQR